MGHIEGKLLKRLFGKGRKKMIGEMGNTDGHIKAVAGR